jgi:hypothetical protein
VWSGGIIIAIRLPNAPDCSGARTEIGTIAASGSEGSFVEPLAHPAGDDRHHDVVDGHAEAVLDLLDLGERCRPEGGRAPARDPARRARPGCERGRLVEHRAVAVSRDQQAAPELRDAWDPWQWAERHDLIEVRQCAREAAHEANGLPREAGDPAGEHRAAAGEGGAGGEGVAGAVAVRPAEVADRGRRIVQDREQLGHADTVRGGMVDRGRDGDAF